MTDDRSSEELSERAVWRAEALAVSAGLGVLGLAYAGFLILDRLAPDSWTWVVRSLTAVAGFWVSARVYRRVLRRRRFKSDALGVLRRQWSGAVAVTFALAHRARHVRGFNRRSRAWNSLA